MRGTVENNTFMKNITRLAKSNGSRLENMTLNDQKCK